VCVPECPVNAIYADQDVPENQRAFIGINAELSKLWPSITRRKDPLPDHERWAHVPDKLQYLDRGTK
jgi:ferredoxin